MNRKQAVDFLHIKKGYSRRLSAKLADVAIEYDGALATALKKALEKKLEPKRKEKIKFIIKNKV